MHLYSLSILWYLDLANQQPGAQLNTSTTCMWLNTQKHKHWSSKISVCLTVNVPENWFLGKMPIKAWAVFLILCLHLLTGLLHLHFLSLIRVMAKKQVLKEVICSKLSFYHHLINLMWFQTHKHVDSLIIREVYSCYCKSN